MKTDNSANRTLAIWAIALMLYTGLFFAIPINLATADLGRHIANGQLLMQGVTEVLFTNHYSYTEPAHPFTNHHWASGVVFHLVNTLAGFTGLSLLYVLLSVGCLLLMVKATSVRVPTSWAILVATVTVPLFAYRVEVRPEGFSYLLLAVYYLILVRYRDGRSSFHQLLIILLPLQILWVNLHIFFFLGLGTVAVFTMDALLIRRDNIQSRQLSMMLVSMVVVSLVNPHFHKGLLAPLTIFNNYGYMVVENQTVFFLQERFKSPQFVNLEIFALIAVACTVWAAWRGHLKTMFVESLMVAGFAVLSFMAVRGIPLFAMFFIPFFATTLHHFSHEWRLKMREGVLRSLPIAGIALCLIFTLMKGTYPSANKGYNALGTFKGVEASGRFLQKADIPGQVFNNYDIGSYLIYFLHDHTRVFVDNRPEAYSVAFFDSIYKPMQENDQFFKAQVGRYGINIICFYRHDATPWAQPFLIRRTQDPEWVPIFVDDVSLILIRNIEENRPWIERYALPKEMFRSVPG
jgi:hypothetical protein